MNNSELQLIKDKKVNDNNWSCLVVFLIESNSYSTNGIEIFEKHARSSKRTDIQNLTPQDLDTLFPKEKANLKEVAQQNITKSGHKKDAFNPNSTKVSPDKMLQALVLKKYILEYKVNDLAKRSETIRYLLSNEINLSDSDNSIPESDYGAFCYFVLTRFYDPSLINELIEIDVPLVAVFELRIDAEYNRGKSLSYLYHFEDKKERLELINTFWDEFMKQLNNPKNKDYFSEFLFLPIEIKSVQWNGKKRENIIYEHILLKLLSINRLMREYIHYINNVEIIDAPTIFTEGNQDIYDQLMQSIPLECVTIEFILHCIVEQVAAYSEGDYNAPYIENIEPFVEEKEVKFPLLFINHRDKIKRMTFNLKTNNQLNLNFISCHMHSLMPYATIWKCYRPQTEVEKALNANQIKKLLTCATEVIAEEKFIILLHLISFNKLLCTVTHSQSLNINTAMYDQQLLKFLSILDNKEKSRMLNDDTVSNIMISNILTKRQVHLNSLKNFLDCNEFDSLISYDFLNELCDLCYMEDLPKETLLQILNKAYANFLHNDNYYCPLTDKLLLWFHNFCDENGLHSRFQEGLLNAMIGFGDFCTYPDNETEKWLSNQKKEITLVDEALKKSYLSRNFSDINPLSFVLNPSVKVKIPFPRKEYMNNRLEKVSFAKVYDSFGLSRIKVSEQTDTFFSVDGPSLTLKKIKWLRKVGSITIILNSHQNLLTLHQSLLNPYTSPIYDLNQEIFFNIQSSRGIIVSSRMKINIEHFSLPLESRKENEGYYETLITLPNGLVVELFKGKHNFIKQTFLDKKHLEDNHLKQEDYRIFLTDGTVIVFMYDGSILILYSNSVEARIKIIGKKPPKYRYTKIKESQEDLIFEENEKMAYEIIRHEIIEWSGKFQRFNKDQIILSNQLYELKSAFCSTRGLFTARSDGTKCHVDPDGILTTSFPDKTITTVIPTIETVFLTPIGSDILSRIEVEKNKDKEPFVIINNKYIMDHPFYMKVEFVSEQWIVHLPFGGQVTATRKGFELFFDKSTNINFNDGLVSVISKNRLDEYKNTLTKIFLKGEVPFEYTICSVQTSDGKMFNVSNTGLTSIQGITALENEVKTHDHIVAKKKIKSEDSLLKPSLNLISTFPKKNNISKATNHFKNQNLLYSKINQQLENDSNLNNATTKPMNKVNNTKEVNRFFVINRDLSGYELTNEYDIKSTLKKYETNFKVFHPFFPCKTVTNDITVCQTPLTKTWNQLYWTECDNYRLYNTNLKKNELLNCQANQKWLCISTVHIPSQKIKLSYDNKPMIDNIGLKHPAMLIRRIKNITTKFNVFKMFKEAVKQFNELNYEILLRYEKNLIPVKKIQSDIDKSEMIFKSAMEELMQSKVKVPFTAALTKGDSISTIASSASSIKLDESEESDDTESLRNPIGSQSESTSK